MKKTVKVLAWSVFVLVILPIAAVLAINAFDEPLTKEAQSYGEPRSPLVQGTENGYYALLGLGASDGADPMMHARAWIDEARAAARAHRVEKRQAEKRAKRPLPCDAAQTSCLSAAKAKPQEVKEHLDAHREDLARYEALIGFKKYEEVLDYPLRLTSSFPQYGNVTAAHRAYVLRAAVEAQSGHLEGALASIERDVAFQRTMMTGARTLLGKIVAGVNYWRDLAFLSDLMQSRTAEVRPYLPSIREMLKSADFPAAGMAATVESEFGFRKALLKNPLALEEIGNNPQLVEKLAMRFLYKPNATLNEEVKYLAAVSAALDLPVNEGSAALEKIMLDDVQMPFRQFVDNPAGNYLRRVATTDEGKEAYARLRLHDVRAYARLVALQAEVLAANIDSGQVASFVAAADARFHDPYTGKPMAWDPASKRLSFEAQARATKARKLLNLEQGRVYVQL